jgi:glycosyltransferase involved in cell wall biosynthesis
MPKAELPLPDAVIISSLSILTIFNGFLLRRKFGCKLIFEIRDIWPLTLTEEGGFSKFNPFIVVLGFVEKFGYKYSDVVVGTMPNLGEHVGKVLGYKREVSCVPMGLDVGQVHDALCLPTNYRNNYIPKEKFLVVYAGSIGITNALEAFLLCAESLTYIPEIQFLIVGDGYLKFEYQKRYSHLNNLIFAPQVPRKAVQSVLKECDLLYFSVPVSEVWQYGQSLNKVIDYMLAGKPIVASYTGYESMINEAQSGSFVPAGDVASLRKEIIRYFEMPKVNREQIGQRGKDWILSNRDYKRLALSYAHLLFPGSVSHLED